MTGAKIGGTGVVGREGSWVKNRKVVSLHLKSESKGLALAIGVLALLYRYTIADYQVLPLR